MSKAKTRRQQQARAAFVATIPDEAGRFYIGHEDGCEEGFTRSGDCFYVDHAAEHRPHTLAVVPVGGGGYRIVTVPGEDVQR